MTIEQLKRNNYELFFSTIKSLSTSQGFYSMLFSRLISMDEDDRIKLINNLPMFKDKVDVVIWLEEE